MNSSNQNKTGYNTLYDPNVALEFFKLFGKFELIKQGKTFFVQGQQKGFFSFFQTDKLYLLVEGSVTIETSSGLTNEIVPGDLFGEFTHYSSQNATATATAPCKLFSISEKQLLKGLKKKPEFLFMLMEVLVDTAPEIRSEPHSMQKGIKKREVLSIKMLAELKRRLGDSALTVVSEKRLIFQKGASALVMYVILEGTMSIMVGDKVIGHSGPGDIVGETALVARGHVRTADVVAETRCSLLAIDRQALLMLTHAIPAFGISILRVLVSR